MNLGITIAKKINIPFLYTLNLKERELLSKFITKELIQFLQVVAVQQRQGAELFPSSKWLPITV